MSAAALDDLSAKAALKLDDALLGHEIAPVSGQIRLMPRAGAAQGLILANVLASAWRTSGVSSGPTTRSARALSHFIKSRSWEGGALRAEPRSYMI